MLDPLNPHPLKVDGSEVEEQVFQVFGGNGISGLTRGIMSKQE